MAWAPSATADSRSIASNIGNRGAGLITNRLMDSPARITPIAANTAPNRVDHSCVATGRSARPSDARSGQLVSINVFRVDSSGAGPAAGAVNGSLNMRRASGISRPLWPGRQQAADGDGGQSARPAVPAATMRRWWVPSARHMKAMKPSSADSTSGRCPPVDDAGIVQHRDQVVPGSGIPPGDEFDGRAVTDASGQGDVGGVDVAAGKFAHDPGGVAPGPPRRPRLAGVEHGGGHLVDQVRVGTG